MFISLSSTRINRRTWLRGMGVGLSLPLLEAMLPVFGKKAHASVLEKTQPRRMLAICNNLGLLPDLFFPSEPGHAYAPSPYLSELAGFRSHFTVFSGVSHPGVDGSHSSDVSFLSAAPHPGGGGFRNSISLDQWIALKIGHETRLPSLTLGVNAKEGRRSLSWTDSGVLIPCENSASEVYKRLFLQGTPEQVETQVRRLKIGESIMDTIAEQSKNLISRLGVSDRDRMDQYLTAVRDLEKRMAMARAWEHTPKPVPSEPLPEEPDSRSAYMEKTALMYRMAGLAFETDSTRSISLLLDGNNSPAIEVKDTKITDGYHNLSHHGKNPQKLAQLEAIDREHMRLLAQLVADLKAVREPPGFLLDHTMVLYGSNFGDANKHTTDNMPVLLFGGGFRHGGHLAFDQTKNHPLPNLFVSMLHRMGIEEHPFQTATGPMPGLKV